MILPPGIGDDDYWDGTAGPTRVLTRGLTWVAHNWGEVVYKHHPLGVGVQHDPPEPGDVPPILTEDEIRAMERAFPDLRPDLGPAAFQWLDKLERWRRRYAHRPWACIRADLERAWRNR